MVVNFKVFKKCSPNGKITLYLGKRDYIDNIAAVEPIDGIVSSLFFAVFSPSKLERWPITIRVVGISDRGEPHMEIAQHSCVHDNRIRWNRNRSLELIDVCLRAGCA